MQQADPVDLQTFQAALAADQQAIVYTILGQEPIVAGAPQSVSGAEVMAFLIDRDSIIAYRHLTTTVILQEALDELRFQVAPSWVPSI
ncbi:MAG: hypothetical protein R2867_17625 [Caldilineaceae bacterium]